MNQIYTLLVCPECRKILHFVDCSDEGMLDRAKCCDRWWLEDDALVIAAKEIGAAGNLLSVKVSLSS